LRVLGCRSEAGVDEPQELTTNPDALLVRVADIDEGRIREVVGADCGQADLLPRLAIRGPGTPRLRFTAQHQDVDHAPPADLARRRRVAGRRPQARMRLLPRARPDVDVPMRVVLPLPAKRPLLIG